MRSPLASQTSKAAQSSSTYGFNIGLELDIDSIESALNEYESRSVGSSLKANNIDITAGNKATIQGSKVEAKESIKLVAQDTTIRSSTDYSNSTTNSEHKNINYSIDLLSGGGPSISASQDRSSFYSKKTTHTSSQLKANNIDITTKERTTIAGANIHSNEQININTKELEVSSVQDRVKQQSQRDGESIGVGSSGLNQIGINNANSKTTQKETILTSITGKRVDIDVKDSIRLYGAMIASIDKDGSDNKNLTLKTDTLEVSSKNNTYQSNTKSSSINLSGSTENAKVSNIGVEYTNSKTNTKTKTLATLGEGNIQITNKDDSDIKMLNRDIKNNEVDIYNIKSHKGLKGEIDTRLFTKEGRKEIKDEIITSTAITNALEQIATTNKAELTDFFKETKKSIDVYEGMKRELQNNPQLAAQLQDPNLTPKEKQEMLREVAITVMVELGYRPKQTKLISTDEIGANDTQVKGHYNTDTDSSYINDKYNDSTIELVETVGHEMTHAMDNQDGILILNDADQNNYANNFGEDLSFYTSNALDYTHDGSLASTNTHNQGRVTSYPSVFNDSTLVKNNREFATLDKSLGDDLSIFIHGTFSSPVDTDKDFIKALEKKFGEKIYQFNWSGKGGMVGGKEDKAENSAKARITDAVRLMREVEEYKFKDNEKLNIVMHSHGGNVGKDFTQFYEGDKKIDNFMMLAVPHRDDFFLNYDKFEKNANIVNVFDSSDLVQKMGVIEVSNYSISLPSFSLGKREIDNPRVRNIKVEVPNFGTTFYPTSIFNINEQLFQDHSNMDSVEVLNQIKKKTNE
jgi:hypothetical protein